ncbi:MAG: glycosyltransferase family 39 protein [Candidatus Shapirobacteria bacterium]|nr:glycosyltransferase family 39 protein [Candidatus Shapirobacteria bacterium]MDD5074164.1 glycosyltransferase family 39 protein [Candidatus Shapirobacteria bacterium]MDD5481863.1 glycosyltransferase family 39 protein [Candidatus Shapirobacteria bacterium]
MNKKQLIFLILVFLLALTLRLYKINSPLADWHSWRQADTASISRNFIKEGFSPLYPKFDSFYALNSYGDKNVNRYFFAEFPLYNIMAHPLYLFFGVKESLLRLLSAFFSSASAIALFFLVKKYSSRLTAYLSALFWAIIPFNVYYGRVTMADPLHVFLSILALLLTTVWLEKKTLSSLIPAGITLALAILTKPYGIVLGLPIVVLLLTSWGKELKKNWFWVLVFGFLSLTPYLLWKWHIDHYPEGQFGTVWLFNSTNIRFTGAFFRWIIFERINKLILGGGGFVLFFIGLVCPKSKKEWLFYLSWLTALAIFITVIASGNVTHDYYQLPLVPILAILAAKGVEFTLKIGQGLLRKTFNFGMVISLTAMMLAFGWFEIRGFYQINNPAIVEAGQFVDQNLPQEARVIAPYNWDPAFLYQTNRWGWPEITESIEEMIKKGATHYVSVNYDEKTKEVMKQYSIVEENERFVVVELTEKF